MSIEAQNWALHVTKTDPRFTSKRRNEAFLLRAIANYVGHDGTCYPSHELLAADLMASKRSVVRWAAWLDKQAFFKRMKRGSHKRAGRLSDLFVFPKEVRAKGVKCHDGVKIKDAEIKRQDGVKIGGIKCQTGAELSDTAESQEPSLRGTVTKESTAVAADARIDPHLLFEKLSEAANGALYPLALGLQSVGEPLSWLKEGADLDVDVLPVVRAISHRRPQQSIRSWGYFAHGVAEAKARRERGLPSVVLPPPDDGSNASAVLAKMRAERLANGGAL